MHRRGFIVEDGGSFYYRKALPRHREHGEDVISILPSPRRIDRHRNFFSARDRKSTRLNSSHSQISYAVFCLKKKKRQSPSILSILSPILTSTRPDVK